MAGLQAFSKAADVFSFGVVLWELATWQLPWEELSVFQACPYCHLLHIAKLLSLSTFCLNCIDPIP